MPFDLIKHVDGGINAIENNYFMADGEGVTLGQALKMVNGRLTKSNATETPEFISMRTQVAESPSKTIIPVLRVMEVDEYETQATAVIGPALVGQKVTVYTDGLQVTATTTGGVFLISSTDGDKKVRGFFRR